LINILPGGDTALSATITAVADYDGLYPAVWFEAVNPADRRGSNLCIEVVSGAADLTIELQGKHSLTGNEFNVAEIVAPTSGGDYIDMTNIYLPRYVRATVGHHTGTTTSIFMGLDATLRQV
jgi:hypothetical protein